MTNSRKQHGIGSLAPDEKIVGKPGGIVEHGVKQYGIFKKIKNVAKKVFKSPIGKAALLGGGLWGLGKMGGIGSSGIGKNWWSKGMGLGKNLLMGKSTQVGPQVSRTGGLWNWVKGNKGKAALLGLGAAGSILPFMAGKDDEEEEGDSWDITPSSIANIRQMARDRHPSLAFMPGSDYVQTGFYTGAKDGGIIGLANGGPAKAQAEQMLRMEYQKYRNQGGTMSYQQFKMQVLQQAQGQGPMAQGQSQMAQPQMAARGGRMGYQGGELVEDASMIEETPTGMMEENVEEVQGEPTREQMEALAMEIFQLRLEELDEEQLMVVYQAAMEQQPEEVAMQEEDIQFNPQMAANGGRIGLRMGGNPHLDFPTMSEGVEQMYVSDELGALPKKDGGVLPEDMGLLEIDDFDSIEDFLRYVKVLEADTPNHPTERAYGGRIRKAEGGIMDLGGMEKDYRAEGGFVPIGGKEKADDVPARLSKNEFVFTADAVRSAGGGDIDQGAEVMQNMMENLEQGGQISEESQGGGGEEIISEEEITEGPNGAQEMYDQQAMLQSRMG